VRSFFSSQRTPFNSRTSLQSVNLIGINRIRPFPFGHTRTFNIRLFVGVWDHAPRSRGFEIKNPFVWCDGFEKLHPGMTIYLPTETPLFPSTWGRQRKLNRY